MHLKQIDIGMFGLSVPNGTALILSQRERNTLARADEIINKARDLVLEVWGEHERDGMDCDTDWAMASIGIESLLDAGSMGGGGALPDLPEPEDGVSP